MNKLFLYKQGSYKFDPPPVYHGGWSDEDWIKWIDGHGEWIPIPLVNEISPKPKTVLEFFKGHRERWIQLHKGLVDRNGDEVKTILSSSCLCLGSAIGFVYRGSKKLDDVIKRAIEIVGNKHSTSFIPKFNDDPETTFEDIIEVCKAANI